MNPTQFDERRSEMLTAFNALVTQHPCPEELLQEVEATHNAMQALVRLRKQGGRLL